MNSIICRILKSITSLKTPYIVALFFIVFTVFPYARSSVYAVAIQRDVYLQNATSTSMDVVWKTDTGGDSVVKYGTAATYGQQVTGDAGRKTIDGAVGFIHHAKLSGLSPDTLYYYQIHTSGTALSPPGDQTYAFKTPPAGASPFTFAVWGDSGTGDANQTAVATQVAAKKPNFVMIAGDISYGGSGYGSGVSASAEGSQDSRYFDPYKNTMKSAVFYPICGNHDGNVITTPTGSLNGCDIVDGDHYLPGGGKMGGVSTSYSADWGNVHITVINSNDNITFNSANPAGSAPQMAWAYNDIRNSQQPWKILVLHHNSWSAGSHSTLTNIRDNVMVMAQLTGVNVVFWGHSHVYERFSRYSQAGGVGKGPYYFTIGNGGKSGGVSACGTYTGGPTCLAASGQGSIPSGSGFLYAQVNNDKIVFNYVGSNGTTYDTVTYSLSEFGPVPTSGVTAIPTSPVATPTIPLGSTTAPTTTVPAGSCALKGDGDANCDNRIDFVDLEILRKELTGTLTTRTADFNGDGQITVVDVELFRKGLYKYLGITPATTPGATPTGTGVILPAPVNLQASCASPGTQATLTWDAVSGANAYWLIIDDLTNTWSDFCAAHLTGDTCTTTQTNSYTFSTTPGHNFRWGIQAYNGLYGRFLLGPEFTCTAGAVTIAPTPPVTLVPTVQPTTGASPTQGPTLPPPPPGSGIWLSSAEIMRLPMSGTAWEQVKAAANSNWGSANLGDLNSVHDTNTLAGALVAVRTNDNAMRNKVIAALQSAKGSSLSRALELSRNLESYVYAADIINYHDPAFVKWTKDMIVVNIQGHSGVGVLGTAKNSPNNWGGHARAATLAVGLYAKENSYVTDVVNAYKEFIGVPSSTSNMVYQSTNWHAGSPKAGVNVVGAKINGQDVSGALPEDWRRAGEFKWPPGYTVYMWGGMEGFVTTAVVLHRAGLIPFDAGNNAVVRASDILYRVNVPADGDDTWIPWLVNFYGNTTYPTSPARSGKNMGWTDWTHAK